MDTAELFTVKVWQEILSGEKIEWRGKIQHAGTGEARYFRDWGTMVKFLTDILPKPKGARRAKGSKSSRGGHLRSERKRSK
jgi:hypothetical protein